MSYWQCRDRRIEFALPVVMGIVNVTPDSFSDGGKFFQPSDAVKYAQKLISEGADIIDVGGESTRPGAVEVDDETESKRILDVVASLKNCAVSVDTRHVATAEKAVEAGASIINNIMPLGGADDPMAKLAARTGAGLVVMHQSVDGRNSPEDVIEFLSRQVEYAIEAGCRSEQVVIDPGFGFNKTREEDLVLIGALRRLAKVHPLLVGLSRKRTLDYILDPSKNGAGTKPDERTGASVAAAAWCAINGASVLRVHDVKDTRQAVAVSRMFCGMTEEKRQSWKT